MDILLASAELAPVALPPRAAESGVGEAVAALAKTLRRLDHKVAVALPRYPWIERAGLMVARRLTPLRFDLDDRRIEATLFDARLPSGVELVLIDVPGQFDRESIYGEGEAYPDNAARFGLYCRALAELVKKRAESGQPFDAVHAHDWPTALLPALLQDERGPGAPGRGQSVRTVLTVHEASQPGLLDAGVRAADVVTTVSPSYADELRTAGVFRERGADLIGILDGIDYSIWSPSTDSHLAARYDAEDASNKGRNKSALQHELGLPIEPDTPLFVSVGRIAEAKGSDVCAAAVGEIVRAGAQLVIGGEGDSALALRLEEAVAPHAREARFLGAVSEPLAHRLVAAADAVLLPSRFEPCGSLQQCAQRYGAAPIAHAVGGLRDTIVDCDALLETGTGFLFGGDQSGTGRTGDLSSAGLAGAVGRALAAMRTPRWAVLRRRMMRLDLSWERPARRYARLYRI